MIMRGRQAVWPEKNRQMSVKVAQKWVHWKNDRLWHLYTLLPKALKTCPKSHKSPNLVTLKARDTKREKKVSWDEVALIQKTFNNGHSRPLLVLVLSPMIGSFNIFNQSETPTSVQQQFKAKIWTILGLFWCLFYALWLGSLIFFTNQNPLHQRSINLKQKFIYWILLLQRRHCCCTSLSQLTLASPRRDLAKDLSLALESGQIFLRSLQLNWPLEFPEKGWNLKCNKSRKSMAPEPATF